MAAQQKVQNWFPEEQATKKNGNKEIAAYFFLPRKCVVQTSPFFFRLRL
jgi:hypothetical protein